MICSSSYCLTSLAAWNKKGGKCEVQHKEPSDSQIFLFYLWRSREVLEQTSFVYCCCYCQCDKSSISVPNSVQLIRILGAVLWRESVLVWSFPRLTLSTIRFSLVSGSLRQLRWSLLRARMWRPARKKIYLCHDISKKNYILDVIWHDSFLLKFLSFSLPP